MDSNLIPSLIEGASRAVQSSRIPNPGKNQLKFQNVIRMLE
jgi:hypothetical protein